MMKNKKMGILAVLVMLVAVTLSSVGGTYAKYISSYGTTDTARVARWDFTETTTQTVDDLFKQSYSNVNGVYVASADGDKVIAPGTSGEYEYAAQGTAETNFKVVETLKITNGVKLENGYDPLEFSLNGTDWVKADDITAVANKTVYAANENVTVGGKIYWRWLFEGNSDVLDTELGKKAVAEDLKIKVEIGTVIEQTEEAPTTTTGNRLYAIFTNKVAPADLADAATIGYDASKANTVFTGTSIEGTVKEYTDNTLKKWFGADLVTDNYFQALSFTIPAGTELFNTSAPDSATKAAVISAKTSADEVTGTVILNLSKSKNPIKFELRKADGSVVKEYVISTADLTFE